MKKWLACIIIFILVESIPATASAKSIRYTTQKVRLDKMVKHNTKVEFIKSGKKNAVIKYKGQKYTINRKYLHSKKSVRKYSGAYLRRAGRIRWGGYSFTWYSQKIMPGLKVPGKHVDKQGFVCDKDGYIVVGSSVANKSKRVIVPTPFGKYGKTYDCGYVGSKHFDCYVNW